MVVLVSPVQVWRGWLLIVLYRARRLCLVGGFPAGDSLPGAPGRDTGSDRTGTSPLRIWGQRGGSGTAELEHELPDVADQPGGSTNSW